MADNLQPEWITVTEYSKRTGRTVRSIYRSIKRGTLQCKKPADGQKGAWMVLYDVHPDDTPQPTDTTQNHAPDPVPDDVPNHVPEHGPEPEPEAATGAQLEPRYSDYLLNELKQDKDRLLQQNAKLEAKIAEWEFKYHELAKLLTAPAESVPNHAPERAPAEEPAEPPALSVESQEEAQAETAPAPMAATIAEPEEPATLERLTIGQRLRVLLTGRL